MLILSILALAITTAMYIHGVNTTPNLAAQVNPRPLGTTSPLVIVVPNIISDLGSGSTFTVQVEVVNMTQFNGWDIQVYGDPNVINATSLSISGNDFAVNASAGSAFESVHCVNGKGTRCGSTDGPGIVHSAFGDTAILSGNGLLFTITYKAIGLLNSPVNLQNDIISGQFNTVQHISINGAFLMTSGGGVGGKSPLRD